MNPDATNPMQDSLLVTLALALDEIRNPGAAQKAGFDIDALCRDIIAKATKQSGTPRMISDEALRRLLNKPN